MDEKEKATRQMVAKGLETPNRFNNSVAHKHKKVDEMQAFAVAYTAKLGWAVLPVYGIKDGHCACGRKNCTSPGKHPILINGVNGASKDVFNAKCWWDPDPDIGYPGANIGIATGNISGFFVLDVDGPEGEESLKILEEKHGPLPRTVQERSGGGGRHFFFKNPPSIDIRPKVRLLPGLDVRGNGSYIVVAPSKHISGGTYKWIVDPFHNKIADPPAWLINFVLTGKDEDPTLRKGEFETYTNKIRNDAPKHTDEEWAAMATSLFEGQRNTTLYTYAYHLLGHGIGPKEMVAILGALNQTYGTPPLSNKELATLIKSALKRHPRVTRGEDERYE